jgi:hypothetical protein
MVLAFSLWCFGEGPALTAILKGPTVHHNGFSERVSSGTCWVSDCSTLYLAWSDPRRYKIQPDGQRRARSHVTRRSPAVHRWRIWARGICIPRLTSGNECSLAPMRLARMRAAWEISDHRRRSRDAHPWAYLGVGERMRSSGLQSHRSARRQGCY